LNKKIEDIAIISFGTGRVLHYYDDPNHDWGYKQVCLCLQFVSLSQWVPKLTNCFWDGMLQKSQTICSEILGKRYHRLGILQQRIL
jgi:hypothetical protein